MNVDVFVRQQWLGFRCPPQRVLSIINTHLLDSRMSTGGSLLFDKTGPVSKIGLQLNYAYKVMDALVMTVNCHWASLPAVRVIVTIPPMQWSIKPMILRWANQAVRASFLLWVQDFTIYLTTDNTGPIILFFLGFSTCRYV